MTVNKQSNSTNTKNKLLYYIVSNGLTIFIVFINLFAIGCLYYYPTTVGIYFFLPYFTFSVFYHKPQLKEGCRWRYFSENFSLFRIGRDYLDIRFRLSKALQESENDQDAQFLFAFFPHGTAADYRILLDGMWHRICPNIGEKIRTLTASILFRIPVVREISLWTGCVDARKAVAERLLDKGYSVVVLPGGEAEQIRTVYQKEGVFLKNRKGFVKLAMRKGVPLVPVYVFGASDYYHTNQSLFGPRIWIQKNMGICIPLATGLWGSFLCPLPVKTTIVFGEPLSFKLKETGSPTDEELDAGHEEFCKSLQFLFNSHKDELGYSNRSLEMY